MLNPFCGIDSCISYLSADAVTADSSHWGLYVSNEALLQGLDTDRRPQISDIRYGSWSARRGLKRGPLLLPGMDSEVRGEFGQHARVQSMMLAHQYRLYPEIIDRSVIDAARVEARLRRTYQTQQPPEKIMSTFYLELGPESNDR